MKCSHVWCLADGLYLVTLNVGGWTQCTLGVHRESFDMCQLHAEQAISLDHGVGRLLGVHVVQHSDGIAAGRRVAS